MSNAYSCSTRYIAIIIFSPIFHSQHKVSIKATKSSHRQNEKEIRQSTHTIRKSHGTNERRGEEKKPCVSKRITRPHRITEKYPKIPKKALQSHETREHFMSFPPPSGEFLSQLSARMSVTAILRHPLFGDCFF